MKLYGSQKALLNCHRPSWVLLEEKQLNYVPGTWYLRSQAPAQTSLQPLPPEPKAARHKLQRKKLHPAVRIGIPSLPQIDGQGLHWGTVSN